MSTKAARSAVCLLGLLGLLGTLGCRQNMHNQHKLEPYEASDFFPDGQGSRRVPAGTVPRGAFGEKIAPYTGLAESPALSPEVLQAPPQVTLALLRRGQERYNVFCSPCHDRVGTGRGMIVRRGYKQPPSFHEPRLRSAPAEYFVTTMAQGFGVMPPYAEEVSLQDRWAIAAYIRALQYSQNARLAHLADDLPPHRRQTVETQVRGSAAEVP